jgi:hypothetical protein
MNVADIIFVPISSCLLSENMVVVYCSLFLVKTKKVAQPSSTSPWTPYIAVIF